MLALTYTGLSSQVYYLLDSKQVTSFKLASNYILTINKIISYSKFKDEACNQVKMREDKYFKRYDPVFKIRIYLLNIIPNKLIMGLLF